MGTDIHAFIEYNHGGPEWRNFGSEFRLDRSYGLFEKFAGVRGSATRAIVRAKGIPSDIAFNTRCAYTLVVLDRDETHEEGATTRKDAERWISQKSSVYFNNDKSFVTHPDWHTPSWLTLEEYEKALYEIKIEWNGDVNPCYNAVLAAMKNLNDDERITEVRLVFWFDN